MPKAPLLRNHDHESLLSYLDIEYFNTEQVPRHGTFNLYRPRSGVYFREINRSDEVFFTSNLTSKTVIGLHENAVTRFDGGNGRIVRTEMMDDLRSLDSLYRSSSCGTRILQGLSIPISD